MFKKLLYLVFAIGGLMNLSACSNTFSWDEEVKLLDGRVITVQQTQQFEDAMPRDVWVRFKLPEFDTKEIVWHEALRAMVLNVYQGNLYIVGRPGTGIEYKRYGRPEPYYIGFRYEKGLWVRIPFNEIPTAIYDTNMWFDNMGIYKIKHLSLEEKNRRIFGDGYTPDLKRINPKHISNFKDTR